jgi:hypothetical protein
MKTTPQLEKREYAVQFTLFQPEKHLEELNTLRNSLPEILKNHKVNIITESQPYGDGFFVFLYILLKEKKCLGPTQYIEDIGRFLGYVEGLIGDRLTTEPKLYNGKEDSFIRSKA